MSGVKKSISKISKGDISGVTDLGLQSITAGQVSTSGLGDGEIGGLLNPKSAKVGGSSADAIAGMIRETQAKGLNDLNNALNTPADQIIREQAARQSKGVLSAAQDARRRAQTLMAQRGLKNSSLGLASDRSITQNLGEQQAQIQASIPGQIRNQAINDANTRINAGGLGTTAGIQWKDVAPTKQAGTGLLDIASGFAPLAGSIAGGMFGGPAGAMAGGQIGGAIGSATQKKDGSIMGGGSTTAAYDYMNNRNGRYS
jgi:hypothetical protein